MKTNINTAIAEANRLNRAFEIIKAGYTFTKDADSDVVAVCKPGDLHASYWINMLSPGCDCPDHMRTGRPCKHMMALEIKKEEEAMMEALCAEWEARQLQEA